MFIPIRFRTSLQISLSELRGDFDEIIKTKIQNDLEGKCSRFGFIKPGSIVIEQRSTGKFVKQHFNGYISYDMICVGDACNPPKNTIVEAVVKNKNALGLLAESYIVIDGKNLPVLDIIVPKRAAGISSEIDLDSLYIGDTINVMIMGKSYQLNDLKISVIGRGVKSSPASYANVNDSVESDNQEESDENASDTSSEHSDDSNENESAINEESDQEEGTAKQPTLLIGGGIEDDLIDDGIYVGGDDEEEDDLEGADAGSEADYFDEQEY